jgi:excisionase family DNA binding protein
VRIVVEILTVQEVATLLKLHPRTVMKMAMGGDLPAAKVGKKWRFDRGRIENWLEARMEPSPSVSAINLSSIRQSELLPLDHILILPTAPDRQEVLRVMASKVDFSKYGVSREELINLLLEREAMFPTAMEYGVAFPHPRHPIASLPMPALVLACVPEGVEFGAPEGEKTHVFAMICAPDDRTHVALLSRLARIFRSHGVVRDLCGCTSTEEVRKVFFEAESTVLADLNSSSRE